MSDNLTLSDSREYAPATPSPLCLLPRSLTTPFDIASIEPIFCGGFASIDIPAQHTVRKEAFDLSVEGFDNVFASLSTGSLEPWGHTAALPSSSASYITSHNLPVDYRASVDSAGFDESDISLRCTHDGTAATSNNETWFPDRLLDQMCGGSSLSLELQRPGRFYPSALPMTTWPDTPDVVPSLLDHQPRSEQQQSLAAVQPGSIDTPFSSMNHLSNSSSMPVPLDLVNAPHDTGCSRTVGSWDLFQTAYLQDMTIRPQIVTPKSRNRKTNSKLIHLSGTETFGCPVCFNFSGDVRSLREHMRCHDKKYTCTAPGCVASFGTTRDLTRHAESSHTNMILVCSICSAVIRGNRKDNLRRHMRTRHSGQVMSQSPPDSASASSPEEYALM